MKFTTALALTSATGFLTGTYAQLGGQKTRELVFKKNNEPVGLTVFLALCLLNCHPVADSCCRNAMALCFTSIIPRLIRLMWPF